MLLSYFQQFQVGTNFCNHVAGLLFRIESANKLGLTSCTSGTCIWVKPSEKKLQPAQIKSMNFKKSRHGKSVTRPLVGKSKADYDVMPEANNDTEACIQKTILASLKDAIPNACVFKGMHNTDDQDTTQLPVPVNQKETADVIWLLMFQTIILTIWLKTM